VNLGELKGSCRREQTEINAVAICGENSESQGWRDRSLASFGGEDPLASGMASFHNFEHARNFIHLFPPNLYLYLLFI
jgi:hypothetical protein